MLLKPSVVITNYNKGDLLTRAVNNLFCQSYTDFEFILVDDCSTDEVSLKVISDIVNQRPVKYYKTDYNRGASYAKNLGISKASNDVIIMLDGDDVFPSEFTIEHIMSEFNNTPEVDFIFGNYTFGERIVDCSQIATNHFLDPCKLARKWILLGSSPFKKSIHGFLNGYNNMYPNVDDQEFFRKMIASGYKGKYINEVIYCWEPSNTGNNAAVKMRDKALLFFRTIEFSDKFLPRHIFYYRLLRYLAIIIFTH